MRKLLYVRRQTVNTSDISHNQCLFSYGQRIARVMVTIRVITGHGQRTLNVSVSGEQTSAKKNMQPLTH